MTMAPVQPITTPRFEPPRNVQFSVFLDQRVGRLMDLLRVLNEPNEAGEERLTLAALSIVDSTDHAVIRLITSHSDLTRRLLERHELPFGESEVLVVELGPEAGLEKVCQSLLAAELNIHFAYPLLVRPRGRACVVLHTDDQVVAAQVLRKKLFTLLGENDLGENATRNTPGPATPLEEPGGNGDETGDDSDDGGSERGGFDDMLGPSEDEPPAAGPA